MKFLAAAIIFFCVISCTSSSTGHIPQAVRHMTGKERLLYVDSMMKTEATKKDMVALYEACAQKSDKASLQIVLLYLEHKNNKYANTPENEKLYKRLLTEAKATGEPALEAMAHYHLARFYWEAKSNENESLRHFFKAEELYQPLDFNSYPEKFGNLYEIGLCYYAFEDYDKAIEYFEKALSLGVYCRNGIYISTFNTLALACKAKGNYDKALEYYFKGLAVAQQLNSKEWQSIIEGNIGVVYLLNKRNDAAKPYLLNELNRAVTTKNIGLSGQCYNYMAQYYLAEQNYPLALSHADSARKYALLDRDKNIKLLSSIFKNKTEILRKMANYSTALLYYDSTKLTEDSIQKAYNKIVFQKNQEQANFEKLEAQIASDKKLNTYLKYGLVLITLLVAAIFLLLLNKQRIKHKLKERLLHDEKSEIGTALDFTKKDLDEKISIIETLEQAKGIDVASLKENEKYEILAQMEKSVLLTDAQWDNFIALFEQIHGNYLIRLKEKYPILNPSDTRILALTKMNYTNRQMASMLGISQDAVRMNKHRIRKKLNIEEAAFEKFVHGI